jgi:hypothetical protein
MRQFIPALSLLGLVVAASPAHAATELRRVETSVELDENTVSVERAVRYVAYTAGETLSITLNYEGTCNVVFGSLSLRGPNPFTPRVVTGTLENVTGTPAPGSPATSGNVTFDLTFDTLKKAGKAKEFGLAHMTLVLGVDEDCDPSTGDADGVDETLSLPVKIFVSTASHP